MRFRLLHLFLCLLLTFHAFGQIDTLRHKSGIEAYVKARGGYAAVELMAVNQVLGDSAAIPAPVPTYWSRADFNHDGADDLLVRANIRRQPTTSPHDKFLVLTGGTNPQLVQLDNGYYSSPDAMWRTVRPITLANKVYLIYAALQTIETRRQLFRRFSQDTLYLQTNRPMLFTTHPAPTAPVTRITYATTQCFGICPAFRVVIKPNGVVEYAGMADARPRGKYRLRMSATDLAYLSELLRNLNLPELADKYQMHWSDGPTCYLGVMFADGRAKHIEDYGMQGTYGLAVLYQFLWQQYQPR
ncbi:DUF6438 domain-containing protein [Hymenobacter edaphi]|uniref:DUF6438 domain-containing protein n=1 Tax=Hymenobacter edaphi TaxID=2211146 RepID=A0A328BTL8_9BACT|nr:DUF6438 domain-containing protein [Hymenobacter edaphi]RAK69949.1 hypothetical protein DLM85_03595 [Hymenobacter edaphi]